MEIPKSFLGYKRENGRAGTRNHVIILPVDDISNACAEAVANNINKDSLFSVQDRINIIKSDISSVNELNSKINVTELSGLLTTFAKDQNATCIIRGLRAVSDFEYEFQMTGMNYQLNPDIETIFLMTSEKNSFISSNFVKEVHKLGGDVSNFVSKNTLEQLNKKNS